MARSPRVRTPKVDYKWLHTISHAVHVTVKPMTLIVGLTKASDDAWSVIALETPTPTKKGDQATVDVLNNHAHDYLGTFGFQEAMNAATNYVNKWVKGRIDFEKCECPPITPAKKRRR